MPERLLKTEEGHKIREEEKEKKDGEGEKERKYELPYVGMEDKMQPVRND